MTKRYLLIEATKGNLDAADEPLWVTDCVPVPIGFTGKLAHGDTLTAGGIVYEFIEPGASASDGNIPIEIGDSAADTVRNFQEVTSKPVVEVG